MAVPTAEVTSAIIIAWVFTWVSEVLMAARLIARRVRRRDFDLGDHLTMLAMLFLVVRLPFAHVIVLWGTSNISDTYRATNVWTDEEIRQREIGSKFALVSRFTFNCYIWLQKGVVMCLCTSFYRKAPWMDKTIKGIWGILVATFVVAQVTTFTDCDPLRLYWQIFPDPGMCVRAYLQVSILTALTIITDLILIILPMITVFRVANSITQSVYSVAAVPCRPSDFHSLTLRRKIYLLGLFSIGFFLIAMSIVRLEQTVTNSGFQINRTLWGSIESFASAFVANIPVLYGLRKKPAQNSDSLSLSREQTNLSHVSHVPLHKALTRIT